jgi:predicted dehydrogenase
MAGAGTGAAVVGCLVGAGFFARNHLQAWRDLAPQGVRIAGICDIDRARAAAAAAEFGAEPFDDPERMLEALAPDLVDVATTPPSHRALVEAAAPHARVVICQKPIAEGLDDARAMVAACEGAGATLLVHENFRWQRGFRRMRELVAGGALGTPRFARFSFAMASTSTRGSPTWPRPLASPSWTWGCTSSTSRGSSWARQRPCPARPNAATPTSRARTPSQRSWPMRAVACRW